MSDEATTKTAPADLRPTGTVTIGPMTLLVGAMDQANERALGKLLNARAKAAFGSYYARLSPLLKAAEGNGFHTAQILNRIADMDAAKLLLDDDFDDYRQSVAGVAFELWYRAAKHRPELTEKEIAAAVNAANSVDVFAQIQAAISAKVGAGGKSTA